MPRSKEGVKRKKVSKDDLETAVRFINEKTMTIGQAAKHFALKKRTLMFHLKKMKESGVQNYTDSPKTPKRVFTNEEELLLVQYLQDAANMHYGLTLKQVRSLTYEYAIRNNKKIGKSTNVLENGGSEIFASNIVTHYL